MKESKQKTYETSRTVISPALFIITRDVGTKYFKVVQCSINREDNIELEEVRFWNNGEGKGCWLSNMVKILLKCVKKNFQMEMKVSRKY